MTKSLLPNIVGNMSVETKFYTARLESGGFELESGERLPEVTLAYETYGELNADKSNAIFLFHAMTGSQHAAGVNEQVSGVGDLWTRECQIGWWNDFIGPARAIDTRYHYVICINYIGGCYGSTGPRSIDPRTNKPYGNSFPRVTITDVVNSHVLLIDHLGIDCLHAVIGSSTGGLLALNFATRFPERAKVVIPIAASLEVSTLQKLHIVEQIYAIESNQIEVENNPAAAASNRGLMLARMIAHKAFVSLHTIDERAGKLVRPPADAALKFHRTNTPVESYMLHQGMKFIERFDNDSYLRILEMWLGFDLLSSGNNPTLESLFSRCRGQRYLIFSISSDVCFYPEQQNRIHQMLKGVGVDSTYITVHSDKGHDSFLLEPELYAPYLQYILAHN